MSETQIKIGEFETVNILTPSTTIPAGTHLFQLSIRGQILLASVFVKAASAPVDFLWFDVGAGVEDSPATRNILLHQSGIAVGTGNKDIVPKIHNSVYLQVTVTGGPANLGILATVVNDAYTHPVDPGALLHIANSAAYIPGSYVTVQTRATAVNKVFTLEQVFISAPTTGTVRVKNNSDIIMISNTSPANLSLDLKFKNPVPINSGEVLTVEFCARANAFSGDVHSFINGYEE